MATKRPREEESSEAIEAAASAGDKSKAPAGGVRLFVGNLDRSRVNDNVLIKVFQAHSKVLKAELVYHRAGPSRGQPRGFAFVSLATAEDAAAAIEALDGRKLFGRTLAVRHASSDGSGGNVPTVIGAVTPADGGLSNADGASQIDLARERDAAAKEDVSSDSKLEKRLAALRKRLANPQAAEGHGRSARAAEGPGRSARAAERPGKTRKS
eukprot:TRINITY_DN4623_c0_g1_i1.p2 TRINITY_DN4623_c0_g1~~TRINITY_DN4623_c0_g1_i1.p2  ORF type:complete len:211 (+),score=48.08 TRINITY_DN4623_c0_g1_i1:29-661(+)